MPVSASDTFHNPTAPASKRATRIVSSNLEQTGQPLDQAPVPNANTLTSPVVHQTANRSVSETPFDGPPPYAPTNNAALHMALLQEAKTAGGTVSMDFSGSTISAGGKLKRTINATHSITETVNNCHISGGKGITEVRGAPNIAVTHKEVTSVSVSGSIDSQTKAAESATIIMTNVTTAADENITINQEATKTLKVEESNVKTYARKTVVINQNANRFIHVVDEQQVHEATK